MTRKADPAFLYFQQKIFQRDQYTCQFCGFQSIHFLEVINLDHNYFNNKLRNMVTACPLCMQCCFMEVIGRTDFGGGTLIYLPEMNQSMLNALCHVLFANIVSGTGTYEKNARNIYRSFKLRSQLVEKELGEGLSSPALCGQMFIDASIANKQKFISAFNDKIRLLPDLLKFSQQVDSWMIQGLHALENYA